MPKRTLTAKCSADVSNLASLGVRVPVGELGDRENGGGGGDCSVTGFNFSRGGFLGLSHCRLRAFWAALWLSVNEPTFILDVRGPYRLSAMRILCLSRISGLLICSF